VPASAPPHDRSQGFPPARRLTGRPAAFPFTPPSATRFPFALYVRDDNRERTPPLVTLTALCGPGNEGETVVRVLLPDED
jgi:hypothetical protein